MNFAVQNIPSPVKKTGQQVYFEGSKKNQINDLKTYLKTILNNPQFARYQKEAIKKIIAYTTQGFDTSKLYPQMVLASATKDIIEKKLIFFYLSKYSSNNADFARMAINTFMKDTNSSNPNIRSLAIRHLSNLRFKGRQQYVMPILRNGLNDFSPIVKRSCVMGIAKVINDCQRKQQQLQRDEQTLNIFYGLIRDSDTTVVCSVLQAIHQIQPQGIAMSKKLTLYLLSNINQYNDMQLPIILKFVEFHEPKNSQQSYEILNLIQSKLKSPVLSVVIGVSKIYLKYAKRFEQLYKNILQPIKIAILSFINYDVPQIQYVALKHIQYLIDFYKIDTFVNQYKMFFLQNTQPTYIKILKMNILTKNCRSKNLGDILNELCEYILEQLISKQAFNCLEIIILSFPQSESKLVFKSILKQLQTMNIEYLFNNSLPLLRNYLRRFPQDIKLLCNVFYELAKNTNSDDARIALIQLIGDYGDNIEDSVELLAWSDTQLSDEVRISLIRANVKLFFSRPYQMFNTLSNMFKKIFTDDSINIYVKDYAAYLYRALQNNPQQFKKSFLSKLNSIKYIPPKPIQLQFNSLEIVYGKSSIRWILDNHKYYQQQQQLVYNEIQTLPTQQIQTQNQNQNQRQININLDSKYTILTSDDFDIQFQLSAQQYQQCWENYQIGSSITRILKTMELVSQQNLQQLFRIWHISTIASAQDQQQIKLYLYAKLKNGEVTCMQFQIMKQAQTMTLLIKSQNQELCGFMSKYIQQFLKINQIL